jgi:hypothetical protein
MISLQNEILIILRVNNDEMDIEDLINKLKIKYLDKSTHKLKSSLLPLLATFQIVFNKKGNLKINDNE